VRKIKIVFLGKAGVGKTEYTYRILDYRKRSLASTQFFNIYTNIPAYDVLDEKRSILRFDGRPKLMDLYDIGGNIDKFSEYSIEFVKEALYDFELIVYVLDSTDLEESIKNVENRWHPLIKDKDYKIYSVIITKLGLSESVFDKEELLEGSKSKSLEECLDFAKKINASYLGVAELVNEDKTEIAILSNYKKLKEPYELKQIGGAVIIPIISELFNNDCTEWLEPIVWTEYSIRGSGLVQ